MFRRIFQSTGNTNTYDHDQMEVDAFVTEKVKRER